jgi:glycosyltransferase involved in cell wall biosynthesis
MADTDIFAFSVRPEEGLGIALIEAMASGPPIVASDVGACREALAGGECGLLVPPGDAVAMAEAIAVLADPARTAARYLDVLLGPRPADRAAHPHGRSRVRARATATA